MDKYGKHVLESMNIIEGDVVFVFDSPQYHQYILLTLAEQQCLPLPP